MKDMVQVRATAVGYYGNARRREGEVFAMERDFVYPPEGSGIPETSWVVPIEGFELDVPTGKIVEKKVVRPSKKKEA